MATERVLKFPRSDREDQEDSSFVLIHVARRGSRPLDLKLVGTEGAAPYTCSLRHDHVSSLRVKNNPVSETEWHDLLVSIFQQELLSNIQITATVQSESSISLTIRKQVQGITQRLGAISLHYDINETIELFDWCAVSVDALTQSKESATESATQLKSIAASLKDLQSQLDELIQAKQEDERALLHNFRNLLNEKKVKIRQQQILITELSANATKAPQEQKSADDLPEAKLSKKRATKRKARAVEPEESDKDFSTTIKSEPEQSDADNTTEATASVPSDDDDDDDDNDDDRDHDIRPQSSGQIESEAEAPTKATAAPPPPRTLPFQRRKPVATSNNADDTDSDDEL
ncbi:hypothetical protein E4U42_007884 [Claviceps africana]|uniref:Mitotic apparatus protein p62 n=1 Tax=Claviceps africana TaxID=83212 RepID=A0A8K0NFX5_9HYPO|nr:hypothetical protein E4U42_007884 [Claviceps africana]